MYILYNFVFCLPGQIIVKLQVWRIFRLATAAFDAATAADFTDAAADVTDAAA